MNYNEMKAFLDPYQEEILKPLAVVNIDERITNYEVEYGVQLPTDYKIYLGDYQCLMLWGIAFSGITRAPTIEPSIEFLTEELRSMGLGKCAIPLLRDEIEVYFMDSRSEDVFVCHPLDVGLQTAHELFAGSFPEFVVKYLGEVRRLG